MTYETAKKLKEAGWPQKFRPFLPTSNEPPKEKDFITYPTLSELIEACGRDFFSLTFHGETWTAVGLGVGTGGPTPSEAVANLWLELNK